MGIEMKRPHFGCHLCFTFFLLVAFGAGAACADLPTDESPATSDPVQSWETDESEVVMAPTCYGPPLPSSCGEASSPWTPACYDTSAACDCPPPRDEVCIATFPDRLSHVRELDDFVSLEPDRRWAKALIWTPNTATSITRYIITLHGTDETAAKQLYWWHERVDVAGICSGEELGVLAIQYRNEHPAGPGSEYLDAEEIMAVVNEILTDEVDEGRAAESGHIMNGFSRGSANMYSLAVLDGIDGHRWAEHFIADSGAWEFGNPPPAVDSALDTVEAEPLEDVRFYIYYGLQDHNPDLNGSVAQTNAADIVEALGATARVVANPDGCHSTFLQGEESDYAFGALMWALGL